MFRSGRFVSGRFVSGSFESGKLGFAKPRSMAFRSAICSVVLLLFSAVLLVAQSNEGASLQFQVSAAQAWTDTALDLQPGDVVYISAVASLVNPLRNSEAVGCDPAGVGAAATNLPLPGAPLGALIASLHAQGAAPILIGRGASVRIQEASHLFLGMNASGSSFCEGEFTVTVQKNSAAATTAAPQQTRGAQLKSQLAGAAQVFMSGQFGMGKPAPTAANAVSSNATNGAETTPVTPALNISSAPLDADLRRSLDSLPRRVNDQFNNQGDMVNFVIIGAQKDVQAALDAATWHIADTDNRKALINAVMQTYDSKDYLAMPMSTLYLFGRKQDFGYEMAEPIAMVASRHHFRIWKAPFTYGGQEVWVGAGTHDIGFAKDKRNNNVTHKIDPAVDGERDNIGSSLQKANKVKSLTYYLPPDPVQSAKNATGDGYHSDGRLLVVFLQ